MWPNECCESLESEFEFLKERYDFSLVDRHSSNMGFGLEYKNSKRWVILGYDYRDQDLTTLVVSDTKETYPKAKHNVVDFATIFRFYEPTIVFRELWPHDRKCVEAIALNAKLLAKYGDRILRGTEWIYWDEELKRPVRLY